MKTVHSRLISTALTVFVTLLTVLFAHSYQVNAVGIGITDDAPIMGITCGDALADDANAARRVCCAVPGETRKVTNADGAMGEEDKAFVRAQFQLTGTGEPGADKPPKKKSIWGKIGGAAGNVAKIGVLTNPATIIAGIATGGFGEVATGIMDAAMDVGMPLVSNVARQQADSAMGSFTEAAQTNIQATTSVDYQCDTTKGLPDYTDPNKCICKPFGTDNLQPGTAAYIDWNKWVASRNVPLENREQLVMALGAKVNSDVLGTSTLAQVTQEEEDAARSCEGIIDDLQRRQCILDAKQQRPSCANLDEFDCRILLRQHELVSPKFLEKCNKISNPSERTQCQQCTVGGGMSEYDENFGEVISGVWTGVGCLPADMGAFIAQKFFPWSLGIGGGVAMLLLMYASFLYTTSRGNPDKLKKARDYMNSALIGLLVIIFAVFLLQLIGVTILRIPGFDEKPPTTTAPTN